MYLRYIHACIFEYLPYIPQVVRHLGRELSSGIPDSGYRLNSAQLNKGGVVLGNMGLTPITYDLLGLDYVASN